MIALSFNPTGAFTTAGTSGVRSTNYRRGRQWRTGRNSSNLQFHYDQRDIFASRTTQLRGNHSNR
jgi:hypothetical protein